MAMTVDMTQFRDNKIVIQCKSKDDADWMYNFLNAVFKCTEAQGTEEAYVHNK